MEYILSKNFEKSFRKLNKKAKDRALDKIEIFVDNPFEPSLKNHPLSGKFSNYRSINVTGDIRIIDRPLGKNLVVFEDIGSHSKLYN